jgi:hypothetical protein
MQIPERAATDEERHLIEWLLRGSDHPWAPALLLGVSDLQVIDICGCGCPSISFLAGAAGAKIVAEADGVSPERIEVGVILWARNERLADLEVYNYGNSVPFSLPKPADLTSRSCRGAV